MSIKLATATITQVFAYLLEQQGHGALDPDHRSEHGYAQYPWAFCDAQTTQVRGSCGSCIALRKYRLDLGETDEDFERQWNEEHGQAKGLKIGDES